jgi:predicted ATP-grasp superfamily ATP-dependent carboligase
MIENVIILGNHIQALGISRIVGKLNLHVLLFSDYNASITKFSNSCKEFYLFSDEDDLLGQLKKLDRGEKKTLIIPTNDRMVKFLADNYLELSSDYFLGISEPDSVDICFNKKNTYQIAQKLGVNIPKSYFPSSLSELEVLIKDGLIFPVIIKPAIMFTFHKIFKKKAFLCNTSEELLTAYKTVMEKIPSDEIIVQEFLVGGPKNLYSVGCFAAKGHVYGGFTANRVRQHPMDFGNSTCFAVTVNNEIMREMAQNFLKGIQYTGMAEVEFMYDEKDHIYKLIEINARPWKWHSIANKIGINLIGMMIDYFNGKKIEDHFNQEAGIGWIERLTDFVIVFEEILHKRMTLYQYFHSMKIPKESAVFSWRDLKPFFAYIILSPYLLIRRG